MEKPWMRCWPNTCRRAPRRQRAGGVRRASRPQEVPRQARAPLGPWSRRRQEQQPGELLPLLEGSEEEAAQAESEREAARSGAHDETIVSKLVGMLVEGEEKIKKEAEEEARPKALQAQKERLDE